MTRHTKRVTNDIPEKVKENRPLKIRGWQWNIDLENKRISYKIEKICKNEKTLKKFNIVENEVKKAISGGKYKANNNFYCRYGFRQHKFYQNGDNKEI